MTSDRSARLARVASLGLVAGLPIVFVLELDLWPAARAVWGAALWRYLPPAVAVVFAACLVAWSVPAVRRAAVPRLEAPFRRAARGGWPAAFVACTALVVALFALRTELIFGDSRILFWAMHVDPALFFFPDVGATFFLQAGYRFGEWTGIGGRTLVRLLPCLCGPVAVVGLWQAARWLTGDARRASWIVALALGTGVVRIFAGHIEVYPYVLAAAALYLWAAVAHSQGRASHATLCLAYGIGVWVHLQFLFLGPSLLFALFGRDAEEGSRPGASEVVSRLARGAAVALAPMLVFLALVVVAGHGADLQTALEKLVRWGTADESTGGDVWIRFFQPEGEGTRYTILSPEHVFYLANAFFIMAPVTPWLLGCLVAIQPRALVADRDVRFLLAGLIPLLVYALLVRPVYGPYDWDLFSLTAVWASFTAGVALARLLPPAAFVELVSLAVGIAVLVSAVPIATIGHSARSGQGPFSPEFGDSVQHRVHDDFEQRMKPWIRPFDP